MGIGFAIRVSTAKMVLEQIVKMRQRHAQAGSALKCRRSRRRSPNPSSFGGTRAPLIAGVLRGGPLTRRHKAGRRLLEVQGKRSPDPAAMLKPHRRSRSGLGGDDEK